MVKNLPSNAGGVDLTPVAELIVHMPGSPKTKTQKQSCNKLNKCPTSKKSFKMIQFLKVCDCALLSGFLGANTTPR